MAAPGSFKEHIACILAEHESLQQRLEGLRCENSTLQRHLRLMEPAGEPRPAPAQLLQTAGAGVRKLEPEEAHAMAPVAGAAEAGAGGEQFPRKLDGHWDVQPVAEAVVPALGDRDSWRPASSHAVQRAVRAASTLRSSLDCDEGNELSLGGSEGSPCELREPPEVWSGYLSNMSDKSVARTPPTRNKGTTSLWSGRSVASQRSILSGEAVVDYRSPMQSLVIRPNSKRRACWDCMSVLMLGYDIFYIPLEAFPLSDAFLEVGNNMDIISTCFWSVDICVTFLTGYHTQGIVEMRPKKIAWRYICSLFWLDLMVACVDWVLLAWHHLTGVARVGKTPRAIRLFRVIRATRLLRSVNISKRVLAMFKNIKSDLLWTFWSLTSILLMLLSFNHYIACGWFALGSTADIGWVQAVGIDYSAPIYCYMTSLHWSLTQHAPASMEVHAVNLQERIYSIFVLLVGLVCFSSLVSGITSAIMHLRKLKSERSQQEATLRQYFQEAKISAELGQRIWQFLQDCHFQHRKRLHYKDLDILELVPQSMKNNLTEELYSPVLFGNPFFRRFGQAHLSVVHEVCHACITERFLFRKEELFAEHKVAENMSFVTMGSMDYYHRHVELCTPVTAGQWACEPALWLVWKHCGSLTAQTSCEIVQLHAQRFRSVSCMEFPSLKYVSAYAHSARARLLSTAKWYTDIWSDLLEPEGPMVAGRLSTISGFLDNTSRWVPKAVRRTKSRWMFNAERCSVVSGD